MGSFDVSCLVTGQSIHRNDECALIVMTPEDSFEAHGPNRLFVPVCLPIFGKYGDYGRIEDIEKDIFTEALEKHMKCSIEQYADYACAPFKRLYWDFQIQRIYHDGREPRETPESLREFGFEVGDDGAVTNPMFSEFIEQCRAADAVHPEREIPSKLRDLDIRIWLKDGKLSFHGWYDKPRLDLDCRHLFQSMEAVMEYADRFRPWYRKSYDVPIVGIPKDMQRHAREIFPYRVAFVHRAAYESFAKSPSSAFPRYRPDDDRQLASECKELLIKHRDRRNMSPEEKEATIGLSLDVSSSCERLSCTLPFDSFRRKGLASRLFFMTYLDHLESDAMFDRLMEFARFTNSMYICNIEFHETRANQQRGSRKRQRDIMRAALESVPREQYEDDYEE